MDFELELNGAELRARKNLHWQHEKQRKILDALSCDPIDLESLKELAVSLGGLVHASIRKKAWPKLAGINVFYIDPYKGPSLMAHKDRAQVLLDVNRCGKRIPPHYSESRRKAVQEQLTRVILRLLAENKELHYYQGLHDIVITFLLVAGEDIAYAIMNKLVNYHIRDFLDVDMNRTKLVIGYLQPLIALEDPHLEQFITRSDCAYYFSLSWLITWYGHVVKSHEEACRLVDVFLSSHPLMPVYMAAAIVLSRSSEVLELECEMSAVHALLSKLPQDLSYEQMIVLAERLFEKHPPSAVAKKGKFKLSKNTLVTSYSRFLSLTSNQRPDHILRHLPPPKKPPSSWWTWFANHTGITLFSLLSVAAPVLLAMLYWLLFYNRTSILDSDSIGISRT